MKQVNDKLTDQDILAECRYQSSQASGSEFASDELTESRKEALKYYLGRARGDELDGRSTIISKDVADVIDSMLTQIMPTFSVDSLVQFEANSEEDESQARLESSFCNYIIMEKNNGFILFETLVKDVLLSKNAVAKITVDIKEDIEKEKYKDLTEDEIFVVLQPTKANQHVDVTKFDEKTGAVNLSRITTKRTLGVDAVAPENFNVTSEWKSQYLDECTYLNERWWSTKSDLIEMGYNAEAVMDLPISTADTKIDSIERNQINDEQNFFNTSPSMQIVELETHYIRIDRDGDGIAELLKVVTSENILLTNEDGSLAIEEADIIPYANGVAFLQGHRFYGLSIYDKLKDVQDFKTNLLRNWSDNILAGAHNKTDVIEDQVNMDDFLSGRPNGVRRMESLDSAREVPYIDIGQSCTLALEYYDKIRTERSGSSLDLQTNQINMPSNVGDQGVNTLIDNLEQVSALVQRNFCETLVKSLYSIVHQYMRMYFPEDITAKINGKWASTNPSTWNERDQVNVSLPPTKSERIVQQVALEKMILHSSQDLQSGKDGITTDESQLYQLRMDHARLSGIDHPEKYLIDPDSEEATQVKQMQGQQAQMQSQKQEQMQAEQYQMQIQQFYDQLAISQNEVSRNYQNDIQQLQFDYKELEEKLRQEYYKVDASNEMEEAKIVGNSTTAIELESIKQQGEMTKKIMESKGMEDDNEVENAAES